MAYTVMIRGAANCAGLDPRIEGSKVGNKVVNDWGRDATHENAAVVDLRLDAEKSDAKAPQREEASKHAPCAKISVRAPANPPARAIAAAAATATIIFAIHSLLYSSKPSGLALLLGAMGAVGMLCAIKWMARLIDYSRQAQRATILPLFRRPKEGKGVPVSVGEVVKVKGQAGLHTVTTLIGSTALLSPLFPAGATTFMAPLSDIKSARVFNAARGTMGVPMVFSLDLEGPWWFVFRTVKNDLRRAVTQCVGQECKVSSRSVTHRAGASVIRLQALADLTYNLKPVTWAKLLLYGKRKITVDVTVFVEDVSEHGFPAIVWIRQHALTAAVRGWVLGHRYAFMGDMVTVAPLE